MQNENNLDTFRENFPSIKCLQENGKLTYIYKSFFNADRTAQEANKLISELGLPLKAIHSGTNSFFTVENEYE